MSARNLIESGPSSVEAQLASHSETTRATKINEASMLTWNRSLRRSSRETSWIHSAGRVCLGHRRRKDWTWQQGHSSTSPSTRTTPESRPLSMCSQTQAS